MTDSTVPFTTEAIVHEEAVRVVGEVTRAIAKYPSMASWHEGYAILKEEVDELWDEIRKRPGVRDRDKLREEATQVAAMALRLLVDLG